MNANADRTLLATAEVTSQREALDAAGGPLEGTPDPRTEVTRQALDPAEYLREKGVPLVLRALELVRASSSDIHFTVVGSGNDRMRLESLVEELGVTDRVSWIPWMPREELLRTYNKFDLFVFPSLHDSGGTAVLEAMSSGLPVLCLDLGGPAMLVTNECGRVIQTAEVTEEQVVASIANYITEALIEPALLKACSIAARKHVQSLTWRANVEKLYGTETIRSRHLPRANSVQPLHLT